MLGITIFHRDLHLQKTFAALPVVMATRPGAESAQNTWRVPADDFGPQQCELRATGDVDRVRVVNRGRPIQLGDGVRLHQGQQQTVQLPALLWIGETLVRLFRVDVAGAGATGMADRFVALDDSSPDDGCPLVPSARPRAWNSDVNGLVRVSDGIATLHCGRPGLFSLRRSLDI